MKILLACLLLSSAACGPSQGAVAKTPTATTKRTPAVAPPASVDDDERHRVTTTSDDVQDAQQAQREAAGSPEGQRPLVPAPPGGAKPSSTPASPDKK
ncbi:MAG: hypothetical protein H0T42_33205 [Deltaproteobacteria bacterium]|nr:hypothetical protein [Deltaproteobacteria bacterium]